MTLPEKIPDLPAWAWAGIGLGAAWLIFRPKDAGKAAGNLANSAGQGAANVATGLFTGLADGLFGIPQTNDAKCKAAIAANNGMEASKYCPAGTLIKAIQQSFADWLSGLVTQPPKPFSHGGYTTGPANPASVLDSNILNGYSFEDLSKPDLYQFDVQRWIDEQNSQNRTLTPVAGIRG